MTDRWSEFADDVESGDPDRVNHVVEEIGDLEIHERVRAFDDYFDGLTTIYAHSDDGYVRQSCVRIATDSPRNCQRPSTPKTAWRRT